MRVQARVPPRVHAEVGLKGMMVEEVDEMRRYCRGGIDRSIDEEQHGRGHSRPSISFHLFGQPVPCLDLKRDRPGYRTEGGWVGLFSIDIVADRTKSRLASWIRLSLNRALLDPPLYTARFFYLVDCLSRDHFAYYFAGLNRGLFTVKGTFVDPLCTMARNADNGVCTIFPSHDDKF